MLKKMYSIKSQSSEVCRMPWFLIEVESTESTAKSRIEYFIVHSVDINEIHSSNMYVNGFVRFDHSQSAVEGKVILASEDRSYVEQKMQELNNKTNSSSNNNRQKERLFFIQYNTFNRDLIHSIIPEGELYWPMGIQQNPGEVIIKLDQNQHRATVLFITEDEKRMENEFEKLKNWCLQKCLNPNTISCSDSSANDWILAQYCKTPRDVVYVILNECETHWSEQNLYKDVVTYIKVGETIFQAIVLLKSQNIQELIFQINKIKECAAIGSLIQIESVQGSHIKCITKASSYQQYTDKIMSN